MSEYCVLSAEVLGASRLIVALGADEGGRAVERCVHRIDLAISAHQGVVLERSETLLRVVFPRCDAGAQAFADMLARVQALPPQRGVRLTLRAGLHCSAEPVSDPAAPAMRVADVLRTAAGEDHALASAELVACLGPGVRSVPADAQPRKVVVDGTMMDALPLCEQAGSRETAPAPAPAPKAPPVGLRLRHGDQTFVVDEKTPTLLFGRDPSCNVSIEDKRASRVHARVELREGQVYLVDQSSNGTSLLVAGGDEQWLRRKEQVLQGIGRFGCGFSSSAEVEPGHPDPRVYFEPL